MRDDEYHGFPFYFDVILPQTKLVSYAKLPGKSLADSRAVDCDNGSKTIDHEEEGADDGVGRSPEAYSASAVRKLVGHQIWAKTNKGSYKATVKEVCITSRRKKNIVKVQYEGQKKDAFISPDLIEVVERPKISEYIRNKDPAKIDGFGFVEVRSSLPECLIEDIYDEAAGKEADQKISISNALQTDVSQKLHDRVQDSMEKCEVARQAMQAVFGTNQSNYSGRFAVESPKVLESEPGSYPQVPHADDDCSSCLFCIMHLKDNQEATRVAKYEGVRKDYPTGLRATCHNCCREEQLPDRDLRRGVHVTGELWHCGHCDSADSHEPFDYEGKVAKAFGELLEKGAPDLCNAYVGRESQRAGDGFLGLPMLVHQGPGNHSLATSSRFTLFFTLRPIYNNVKKEKDLKKYNSEKQIHASYVLYNYHEKVKSIYNSQPGCSIDGHLSGWLRPASTQRKRR